MTEEEVQTWGKRMYSIWTTRERPHKASIHNDHVWFSLDYDRHYLRLIICRNWKLNVQRITVSKYDLDDEEMGHLSFDTTAAKIEHYLVHTDRDKWSFKHFAEQNMQWFRQNAWLSGADIEATLHEKVEWARRFPPEEIALWGLVL